MAYLCFASLAVLGFIFGWSYAYDYYKKRIAAGMVPYISAADTLEWHEPSADSAIIEPKEK